MREEVGKEEAKSCVDQGEVEQGWLSENGDEFGKVNDDSKEDGAEEPGNALRGSGNTGIHIEGYLVDSPFWYASLWGYGVGFDTAPSLYCCCLRVRERVEFGDSLQKVQGFIYLSSG